jgi:hypothetical protein
MAQFRMTVARKVVQVMEITVQAADLDEAFVLAGEQAGSGREQDAEYEVIDGHLEVDEDAGLVKEE